MKYLIKTSFLFWLSCFFTACGSAEDVPEAMSQERLSEVVSFAFPAQDYERVLETFEELEEDVRAQMVSQIEEAEVASAEEDLELTLPVSHWHELVLEYQRWLVREEIRPDQLPRQLEGFMENLITRLERAGYPIDQNPEMARWSAAYMEHAVAQTSSFRSGHIRVRVLDQEGDLVDGVELRVSWSYPDMVNWSTRNEYETLEVDGTYDLPTRRSIGIHVEGRKEGYYRNRIFIAPDEHEEVSPEATRLWRKIVLGEEITETDVDELAYIEKELLLRKKGEIVQLQEFQNFLEIHQDGSGVIARMEIPERLRPAVRHDFIHSIESVEDYLEDGLSSQDILFLTDFTEDGFAELVEVLRTQVQTQEIPKRVVLKVGDEDGGFFRVDQEEFPWREKLNREMHLAPEDEYQREMILEGEEIRN